MDTHSGRVCNMGGSVVGFIGVAIIFCFTACERPPGVHFDPEMPQPGGLTVTLREEGDTPVLATDSPIALKFDSDERFFYGVNDAALLSHDAVAIANTQTGEIFVFDSVGRFVRAIGRSGGGPGEFQNLKSIIAIGGDTIVAFDSQTRIASLFLTSGEFLEGYSIDGPPEASTMGAATLPGSLGPRRFLVWTFATPTAEVLNQQPNQVVEVPLVAFASDPSGNSSVLVGKFPGDDQWFSDVSGTESSYGAAPFAKRTWFGTLNGNVVVLRNSEPGFRVLRNDGSPHAVYYGDMRARKVTGQDREQYLASWFTNLQEEPYWPKLSSLLEAKGFPERMPYYRDAIVGNDGIVWLEPYETWRVGERLYVGYDSAGVAVGKLRFPKNDRLLEIGSGIAVVLRIEELGTADIYMQRFRLP